MRRKLAIENPDFKLLDEYWNAHRLRDGSSASQLQSEIPPSPSSLAFLLPSTSRRLGGARDRVDSQASSIPHTLAPHHPAWSLTTLLDTFGPLIFPIYRAALARKRILINCHAPVRQACDFVYDLSVLSNIPLAASSLLSEEAPAKRSRPLFNIGVHDIPLLERDHTAALKRASGEYADGEEDEDNDLGRGWIACTTDGILAMKTQLYDVLVTLPPTYAQDAKSHSWPKVESTGKVLKATQRDLRRFQNLSWALSRSSKPTPSQPSTATATNGSQVAKLQRSTTSTSVIDTLVAESPNTTLPDTDTIVEPLSWTALAYNGFLWWASAGEGAIALNDETESDSALLEGLEPTTPRSNGRRRTLSSSNLLSSTGERDESAKKELALIAYFHRLTTQILSEMAGMVEQTDTDVDDDVPFVLGEEQEDQDVVIRRGDLIRMGLDEWSTADREWVVEMMGNYFGRGARMEGEVDICGVRVC